MTSYVALLRGVNVGGNKMVAMAELRDDADGARLRGREDAAAERQRGVSRQGAAAGKLETAARRRR